ncbi:pyruvate kinase [Thalassospira lucentensis]|uniref:Pyruvate kinase n=2 Tax=Thalassospira TaxID=168934 RepID=A0A154KZV9_9PROT|nr:MULTISPECIES: pyruvate kinase [Thalassospira]KZB57764.1 pyruvate kinase [Thalassospira xiamenensis]KZB64525.1 pyruvate kinase [Thalassospira lucentensis]MCH2274576.1 pyruvate kinase [Thalassospira sp.]MCK2165812.1 pyruvate kinase [Thalassospira xiamenensis]RCK45214.1 pyruvate kinase [Thalassospira xiamenensis]
MRRQRKAKIIATLGPASSHPETLEKIVKAGVDVFRLNFSHGEHAEHQARFETIREVEAKLGRPIGVLMDLQGPKIRCGTFADEKIELEAGATFHFDMDKKPGDKNRVSLPHPEVFAALKPGANLLLDDGKLRMRVEKCDSKSAECTVITGGPLSNRKGVNLPDVMLPMSPLTDKDRIDLDYGLEMGVDFVALSFVQRPEDVAEARKIINGRAAIVSKLEKPQAIEHLDEIVALSDIIMVARGDLGVECPPEDVPILQKRIIKACREAGKPVIVATQMLDSMVSNPAPTRAEASDVATAIYDGADAVMLSAESAVGKYPIETVSIMDRIMIRVEQDELYYRLRDANRPDPEHNAPDAISAAARQVAGTIGAKAVVTYTTSGSTSLRAARERPEVPILGLTPKIQTARRMTLCWGVHAVFTRDATNFAEMVGIACEVAKREEFAGAGDSLVITAGVPFGTPGATNILRIAWLTSKN